MYWDDEEKQQMIEENIEQKQLFVEFKFKFIEWKIRDYMFCLIVMFIYFTTKKGHWLNELIDSISIMLYLLQYKHESMLVQVLLEDVGETFNRHSTYFFLMFNMFEKKLKKH